MDNTSSIMLVFVGILTFVAIAAVGAAVYLYTKSKKSKDTEEVDAKVVQVPQYDEKQAIEKASEIARNTILEAEKKALEIESKAQETGRNLREKFKEQEAILDEREKKLLERTEILERRFDAQEKKEKTLEELKTQIQKEREGLATKLEEIASLSKKDAETLLKQEVERDLQDWIAKKVRESENQISQQSDDKAKAILVESMLSGATDYVVETTTTTFTIEDEALKGKIIGKDGRNIRTFEKLTGVDVIIDEAPNQVTLSCFDPIRREVGSLALQKLLDDGRVHPGAIEETIDKVKKDVLKVIKKTGEDLAYETGFNNLPNEIIMLLGRFKYRFSYGQNLVKHTLEMVKIAEALAAEIGADVQVAKLACLLHDVGKVAPEEGKQHHHISADIARKYFKDPKLINAIEAHHYDIEAKFIEAEIVRIADAISGARPGARRDSYEEYVKRVRALEDIASQHKGVKEAYAIHAGREIRVIVKPESTSDEDTKVMAYKIAREIEKTQSYPGVIKVNVIREYRATDEAK